jgi:NAD(P)H-hydrate epimerase
MSPVPVLTAAQSRAWDLSATAAGSSIDALMESAGRAVARITCDRFAMTVQRGVLVACGSGNNGGDGWVAARALHAAGVGVWVTELAAPSDGPASRARAAALRDGVRIVAVDGPWPGVGIAIDALLGTGAIGAPRGEMMPLLQRIVDLHVPVVAVDGPTGLDLDTGVHHGPLHANCSVTFGGARRGHLLARDEVGDLIVVDIGLPAADALWSRLVDDPWARQRVPPFAANTFKNSRGRVVIVGGMPAMLGAARMAARAAFGAGAGLVHVIAPEESIAALRLAEPDVQTLAHNFALPLSAECIDLLKRADAVAIGPGLGREKERTAFVLAVLDHVARAVIDADALTMLKGEVDALTARAADRPLVLTPHVGEFRTLFPDFGADLETAPWEAAQRAAESTGATVLLKGVPTVVASRGAATLTVAAGNPGLATGGSGDVLTGIIAALLAQKVPLPDAAAVGAQAHGEAADNAARRVTARAMRPMDVVTGLQDVWRAWGRTPPVPRPPILVELPAPRAI